MVLIEITTGDLNSTHFDDKLKNIEKSQPCRKLSSPPDCIAEYYNYIDLESLFLLCGHNYCNL